jgi:DNA-binding LytR/AlgR family response regulator
MAHDDRGARMTAMRVVIAEDEATIARRLARLTTDILGPLATVSIAGNLDDARSAAADVLILDLNLEGRDGFELLREPSLRRCPTIVVSAHTDRALEAYELGIRDFVPKPFGRDRLELALRRALESAPRKPRHFGLRDGSETHYIAIDDVVYVRADGARCELVLAGGKAVRDDRMLDRVQNLLPDHFERVHKSFLVDVRRIERLIAQAGSRYVLRLVNGTELPVGRTRVSALRSILSS